MHDEISATLKSVLAKTFPLLQPWVGTDVEPHLVWRKREDGTWYGGEENLPSLFRLFSANSKRFDDISAPFIEVLLKHHPEYRGLVGSATLGMMNLTHDRSYILRNLIGDAWDQHKSFALDEAAIDALVQDFAAFVDAPSFRVTFVAELLNFRSDSPVIPLPGGLTIRRLSEDEVSAIHGGPRMRMPMLPVRMGISEFVLAGECEEPKVCGESPGESAAMIGTRANLNRAIFALRTFKEGRVGYDFVRFSPARFCPLPRSSIGYGDLHVPLGSYTLTQAEIEPFRDHARLIFANREPAIDMACSRLADAQNRLLPQDRLVDAVIGLECLLLAGLRSEDRRGELKFRFSLHYSTFFDSPEERYRAFRVAKDIYDFRSIIAHGEVLKQGERRRVGAEKLLLADAAVKACEMLRGVVKRFLPESGNAPYKRPPYWEKALFGLTTEP